MKTQKRISTQPQLKTSSHRHSSIRFCLSAAALVLLAIATVVNAQTSLTYLQVPAAGNMPGAGNDGPSVYNLPGYGNVQVSLTNPSPPEGVTYFDQLNAYNETTNNVAENIAYGSFNWGTDTQRFDILNSNSSTLTYQFNFTFQSGAPNPADLYFVVDGLAYGTTATVSQAGTLVGEYQFPYDAGYYPAGPSSTTLYNVVGPQTFSSLDDHDPLNTGWALWQPSAAILGTSGTGSSTLSFDVSQIPGDGIGFTVGYTTVPEPSSLAFLGVGSLALLSRRRRKLAAIVVPAIALALINFTGPTARANFVSNYDFSSYTGSPPKDFFSNVLPTDWSSGGYIFVDAPGTADNPSDPGIPVWPVFPYSSPIGGNFIEADASGLALPLTQTISGLISGQNYNLSFYQAAGQQLNDYGATTEQWEVSLGSQTQYSTLMNNPSAGVTPWMTQSMTFTATGSSEVLSFVALGSGGVPPIAFLDGADLESTVPEPSAWLLLAVIGTVIAFFRPRRRSAVTNIVAA